MNPIDWEAVQRLQRSLQPNHQSGVNNSMETASGTDNDWDTYCQYSRYTADEPQSSVGVDVGWKGLSPPPHNFYIKESEVEDPDGEPLEMDEEDPELTRKRKELKEIEEQILRKKVAIALKTVEPFVKETVPPGFSCNEQSATCKAATLKDRVTVILQQRHSVSFLSQVWSPKERLNSSRMSKDGLLQEDHSLKLRVKALMKQRCSDPCVLPKVTDVAPPPPSQSVPSPAKEENSVNQGFQRFLSVLNKGVDMDLLSRIVNDDSEDLLNIQPPAIENKSDPPFRSESQRSNSGASLPGHSRTNSVERKSDPPSQERSLNERFSLPDDDTKKNDRGDPCFGSSSRSKSPPAVKKKKKKKKEEEKPKVDEQHEHLQNILKTLGMSLEVEEMSKLADRTQERLYGKKHEGMKADSRGEQESQQKGSHRHYRNSSSSSSSSSSSRSTSRSLSSSPSRRRGSHSRDSKQRRTSERSRSRDRSRDGLTRQDGNQDSKEAQRHRDKDGKDSKETSTYQNPYPQNQTYPHPHPAAFSAFPDYSLSQYSQYNAYHSGTCSTATDSYWTYTQGDIPPSPYPSEEYPYQENTYHHFPGSVVSPKMVYPHHNSFEDTNLFVNPDLSKSEGQIGSASGLRCLQVISTKPTTQSYLKQLTKGRRRTRRPETRRKSIYRRLRRQKYVALKRKREESAVKVEAPQSIEDDSEDEQSEEEKQPPTEEEIKANLRKKLEAFNQKVKQNVTQPANSLTSPTG